MPWGDKKKLQKLLDEWQTVDPNQGMHSMVSDMALSVCSGLIVQMLRINMV